MRPPRARGRGIFARMKRCPFCAEEIQDAAIKCRHCNSMLQGDPATTSATGGAPARNMEPARPLFDGSPSWKGALPRYAGVALIGVVGVVGGAVGVMSAPPWGALVGVLAVVSLALFGVMEFRRRAMRYRVTTRTIDIESGILNRKIDTLQLWRVRDVEFRQTFSQRLFGVGTIRLLTHDALNPEVVLAGVADARGVFDEVKRACETAGQQRNVVGIME